MSAGSEGARLNLAHFYELGIGTKKDLAKAAELRRGGTS
ncbi:MAG: SEL1-like repeat protein [Archangium sp.]|nr:SEL1-like repeat protein [Archangium sp.]